MMYQVLFFANGNSAVFDNSGKQVPKLQKSWSQLFAEHLESEGYDPSAFALSMPDGAKAHFEPTEERWIMEFDQKGGDEDG